MDNLELIWLDLHKYEILSRLKLAAKYPVKASLKREYLYIGIVTSAGCGFLALRTVKPPKPPLKPMCGGSRVHDLSTIFGVEDVYKEK